MLIGERIQDPRNAGVLVRTAEAWASDAGLHPGLGRPLLAERHPRSTGSILRVAIATGLNVRDLLLGLRGCGPADHRRLHERGYGVLGR